MKVMELQTWIYEFSPDELIVDKVKDYLDFIKDSIDRYDESCYSEWHHVIPKCIDRDKKFRNQGVQINGRDHVLAHRKLVDCFSHCEERKKLGYALHMMLRGPLSQRLESITPEEYEEIRCQWSKNVTGFKRHPEICAKISHILSDGRLKGDRHPMYGRHHSDETREKISESNRQAWTDEKKEEFSIRRQGSGNPCYGKKISRTPASEDTRRKMSESGRGKIWINDGTTSTKITSTDLIPEGWSRGRLSFTRSSNGQEGKIWINNGDINKKIPADSDLPEGFVRGRISRENKVS